MSRNAKAVVHRYLEKPPDAAGPRLVQMGIMAVILVNVAAVVIGTVHLENGEGSRKPSRPGRCPHCGKDLT